MRKIDLTGKIFTKLTAIREVGRSRHGNVLWECSCCCGTIVTVRSCDLKSGNTKSCGCHNKETRLKNSVTHGKSKTPEYRTWKSMRQRCESKNNSGYHKYGARGIGVCSRWSRFENFYLDMGEKPTPNHSIERINNDGDYRPGNCKWATKTEQVRNQRPRNTNTSGVRGVIWYKPYKKWVVTICNNYKHHHIGYFDNLGQAISARKGAEARYWNV